MKNTTTPIDKDHSSPEACNTKHVTISESVAPGGDGEYGSRPSTVHHLFCSPFQPQLEAVLPKTGRPHSGHIMQQLRDEGLLPLKRNIGHPYFIPAKEINESAKRRMTARLEPIARGHSDYSLEERHLMADVKRRERINETFNRAKLSDDKRQKALERRVQRHKELSEKLERKMRDVEERIKRREKSKKRVKSRILQDMDTNEL